MWNETRKELITLDFSSLCRGPTEPMYSISNATEGHDYVVNVCAPVAEAGKCLPAEFVDSMPGQKKASGQGWWSEWTTPAMYGVATQLWGPTPTCDPAKEQGPQCRDPTSVPAQPPTAAPTTGQPTKSPTVRTLGAPTAAPTAPTNFPTATWRPTASPSAWSDAQCAGCTRPCAVLGLAGAYSNGPVWTLRDPGAIDGGVAAVFPGVVPLAKEPFQCPFDTQSGGPAPRRTHYRFACDPSATEPTLTRAYQGSNGICRGHAGAEAFATKEACEAEQAKWGCVADAAHEPFAPPCAITGRYCLGGKGAFLHLTTQAACEAAATCSAGPDGKGTQCDKTTSSCQGWKNSHQYTTEAACAAASACVGPKTGRGAPCTGGTGFTMAPFWGLDRGTTTPYWAGPTGGVKLPVAVLRNT